MARVSSSVGSGDKSPYAENKPVIIRTSASASDISQLPGDSLDAMLNSGQSSTSTSRTSLPGNSVTRVRNLSATSATSPISSAPCSPKHDLGSGLPTSPIAGLSPHASRSNIFCLSSSPNSPVRNASPTGVPSSLGLYPPSASSLPSRKSSVRRSRPSLEEEKAAAKGLAGLDARDVLGTDASPVLLPEPPSPLMPRGGRRTPTSFLSGTKYKASTAAREAAGDARDRSSSPAELELSLTNRDVDYCDGLATSPPTARGYVTPRLASDLSLEGNLLLPGQRYEGGAGGAGAAASSLGLVAGDPPPRSRTATPPLHDAGDAASWSAPASADELALVANRARERVLASAPGTLPHIITTAAASSMSPRGGASSDGGESPHWDAGGGAEGGGDNGGGPREVPAVVRNAPWILRLPPDLRETVLASLEPVEVPRGTLVLLSGASAYTAWLQHRDRLDATLGRSMRGRARHAHGKEGGSSEDKEGGSHLWRTAVIRSAAGGGAPHIVKGPTSPHGQGHCGSAYQWPDVLPSLQATGVTLMPSNGPTSARLGTSSPKASSTPGLGVEKGGVEPCSPSFADKGGSPGAPPSRHKKLPPPLMIVDRGGIYTVESGTVDVWRLVERRNSLPTSCGKSLATPRHIDWSSVRPVSGRGEGDAQRRAEEESPVTSPSTGMNGAAATATSPRGTSATTPTSPAMASASTPPAVSSPTRASFYSAASAAAAIAAINSSTGIHAVLTHETSLRERPATASPMLLHSPSKKGKGTPGGSSAGDDDNDDDDEDEPPPAISLSVHGVGSGHRQAGGSLRNFPVSDASLGVGPKAGPSGSLRDARAYTAGDMTLVAYRKRPQSSGEPLSRSSSGVSDEEGPKGSPKGSVGSHSEDEDEDEDERMRKEEHEAGLRLLEEELKGPPDRTLGPGDFFGELQVIFGGERRCSVRPSKRDVRLWRLPAEVARGSGVLQSAFGQRGPAYNDFFHSSPLLEGLTEYVYQRLCDEAHLHEYEEGDIILKQGGGGGKDTESKVQAAQCLLFLLEGRALVTQNDGSGDHRSAVRVVWTLRPGEHFGEVSLITGSTYTATVTATGGKVKCLAISRAVFGKLLLPVLATRLNENLNAYSYAPHDKPTGMTTIALDGLRSPSYALLAGGQTGATGKDSWQQQWAAKLVAMRSKDLNASQFHLEEVLGKGACGTVRLARYNEGDEFYAIKVMEKTSLPSGHADLAQTEKSLTHGVRTVPCGYLRGRQHAARHLALHLRRYCAVAGSERARYQL
eukprot:jgi/Mesvir1/28030/Mv04636-RA.2